MLLCGVVLLLLLWVSSQRRPGFQGHLLVCLCSGAVLTINLPPSEQPETSLCPFLSYTYFLRKYHWVLI